MIGMTALRLAAPGVFDVALSGLSGALKWLLGDWRHLVIAAESAALGWLLLVSVPGLRSDLAAAADALAAEQAAHLGTVNAFLSASHRAQREAEANVIRVRIEQEAITDAKLADYRADLGVLRARFDRLRAGAARTDPGRPDAAGLSGLPDAAGRTAAAAPDHHLRPAGELSAKSACPAGQVCLSIDEAEAASEDALRFDRLIDWVLGQSAVRVTIEEPAGDE